MKKSRASLEPFWDLKIRKYVEILRMYPANTLQAERYLSLRSTIG